MKTKNNMVNEQTPSPACIFNMIGAAVKPATDPDGECELPPGRFRGEEELPPGGFRGEEELPAGGFRCGSENS
jgi:hypothetical protein